MMIDQLVERKSFVEIPTPQNPLVSAFHTLSDRSVLVLIEKYRIFARSVTLC